MASLDSATAANMFGPGSATVRETESGPLVRALAQFCRSEWSDRDITFDLVPPSQRHIRLWFVGTAIQPGTYPVYRYRATEPGFFTAAQGFAFFADSGAVTVDSVRPHHIYGAFRIHVYPAQGVRASTYVEGQFDAVDKCPPRALVAAYRAKVEQEQRAQEERDADARRREADARKRAAATAYRKRGWSEETVAAVLAGRVRIGMTKAMARAAWGEPSDINRTITASVVHEQWVYGDSYLYFDNGILTTIQN
jgi:hypothetical protein